MVDDTDFANWPFSQLSDFRDLDLGSGHTAYHTMCDSVTSRPTNQI